MPDDGLRQGFAHLSQFASARGMIVRDIDRSKGFGFVEMSVYGRAVEVNQSPPCE